MKYKSELIKEYLKPVRVIKKSSNVLNVDSLFNNNETQIYTVEPNCLEVKGKGFIILDFGRELQGGIRLLAHKFSPSYQANLRLRFGESVDETCVEIGDRNAVNHHSLHDFSINLPHLSDQEFGKTGFRFIRIDFLDEDITYRFSNIYAAYTHTKNRIKGKFKSDNKKLNKIFNVASYTLYLNCQENLFEGIKRDRLVWIGDMQPEVLGLTYLFNKSDLVYKAIRDSIRKNPLPCWFGNIPVYSFWLIQIVYDYYLKNNNTNDVLEVLPYINNLISQLNECVSDDGDIDYTLSKADARNGYFLDWPSNETTDAKEGNRFIFIITLNSYKKLCTLLKKEINPLTDKLLEKLNKPTQTDVNLKQVVALGYLANRITKEEAKQKLLKNGVHGISIFMSYFIFKVIKEVSDVTIANKMLEEYYYSMIKRGATTFWEDFDISMLENSGRIDRLTPKGKKSIHGDFGKYCFLGFRHSLCHGWSCGPIQYLFEEIIGIKVLEPGCKTIQIKPSLGELNNVSAVLPTPFGNVKINIKKIDNNVTIHYDAPEGVKVII